MRTLNRATTELEAILQFNKTDPYSVAWKKDSNTTLSVAQTIYIGTTSGIFKFNEDDPITFTANPVAGTDYAIWCTPQKELVADSSFVAAPVTGAVRVGGFHFAPGGNAPLDSNGDWQNHLGGDTTPQINEYSFYDLKFKPGSKDPRGLTLVAGSFWTGIYLLASDHMTGVPHRHGVSPARDGNAPQKPFGGRYGNANWWNCSEALQFHGFRNPTGQEFQMLSIGVLENASRGNDPVVTGLNVNNTGSQNPDQRFTSHWGVIQATGVIRPWGEEITVSSSNQETSGLQGRGDFNRFDRAANFGGDWGVGAGSGSRGVVSNSPWSSSTSLSARGVTRHVILV